jgi:hypothetical protein
MTDDDELMQQMPLQRQDMNDDELMQQMPVQRQDMADDEELMQQVPLQRQDMADDDELMQQIPIQRREIADEAEPVQQMPVQRQTNSTGMPDSLKSGVEGLSGLSLDDVRVHYNSPKPAQMRAHAYTQGTDIHVAPGQHQHLAHEAWHVVQQKEGRVQALRQLGGQPLNDDPALESEADRMGRAATQFKAEPGAERTRGDAGRILQRVVLPLDDVDALRRSDPHPSKEDLESAQVISTAVERRTASTHETVVRPWDERFRPFSWGPLDGIGNEELRIFGHGEHRRDSDIAERVGGYTPAQLVTKLKELGLRSTYAGVIYLSGCKTAGGQDLGYLGAFYDLIKAHAPAVHVKGNLGDAITRPNGKQAIFRSGQDKELYEHLSTRISEEAEQLKRDAQVLKTAGSEKTQAEFESKIKFAKEVDTRAQIIKKLSPQLIGIFYAEEDKGGLTVELPGEALPSFDQSGFGLFESPDILQLIPLEPIDVLKARIDRLDTSTLPRFGRKSTSQLMRDAGAQPVGRADTSRGIVQRVVVTVRAHGAGQASEDMQHSTTENLRDAKGEAVVDTLFNLDNNPLAAIQANETLYVVGHGSGDTISGKSPTQLLTLLEEFGLTNAFKGLFDLTSCHSAQYVRTFTEVLREHDYTNDVKGYLGLVHVTAQGDFEVLPGRGGDLFLELTNRLQVAYRQEKAGLDETLKEKPEDPETLRQSQQLDSDYNKAVAVLNGMFEPAAQHEVFSSHAAWLRHGTPTTLQEAAELGRM